MAKGDTELRATVGGFSVSNAHLRQFAHLAQARNRRGATTNPTSREADTR